MDVAGTTAGALHLLAREGRMARAPRPDTNTNPQRADGERVSSLTVSSPAESAEVLAPSTPTSRPQLRWQHQTGREQLDIRNGKDEPPSVKRERSRQGFRARRTGRT